ncbi:SDR family oxidoreductase, partial [Vibrio parahaemolyticus]
PYSIDDATNPLNQYGLSKREGELLALKNNPSSIIIRTSWVYSSHGHNFVKTMLRLMKEKPEIKVVADQIGGPTYARDLAEA